MRKRDGNTHALEFVSRSLWSGGPQSLPMRRPVPGWDGAFSLFEVR